MFKLNQMEWINMVQETEKNEKEVNLVWTLPKSLNPVIGWGLKK